jgi:hypothetical protein
LVISRACGGFANEFGTSVAKSRVVIFIVGLLFWLGEESESQGGLKRQRAQRISKSEHVDVFLKVTNYINDRVTFNLTTSTLARPASGIKISMTTDRHQPKYQRYLPPQYRIVLPTTPRTKKMNGGYF